MIQTLRQSEWQGHTLLSQILTEDSSTPFPFITVLPREELRKGPVPWVMAVHGYTSSKMEWLEMDGYTKGGNLTLALLEKGIGVVAPDLCFHGENKTAPPVDYDTLLGEEWEEFFFCSEKSIRGLYRAMRDQETMHSLRIGYLSYSLGGVFGFWLASRGIPFLCMNFLVPPVFREEDDEYCPFNNLKRLNERPLLMVSAEQDEHIPFEDSEWLYEQIPVTQKEFLHYPSGHDLPLDYVPHSAAFFGRWL